MICRLPWEPLIRKIFWSKDFIWLIHLRVGVSMQTVLCLKWGDRYGPDYVNRLHASVMRNTKRPLRFICITDDPTGINELVEVKTMPAFTLPEVFRFHPFRRMFLFDKQLYDISGDVLHFDLDLVITSNIDPLFDFQPESTFCVPQNWTQEGKRIGNMSVFRFRIGEHYNIWKMFSEEPLVQRKTYRNSQTFVSRNIKEITFYPASWCLSFKHSLLPKWPLNFFKTPKLPQDCIVLAFTGKPDIDDVISGKWPAPWYKKIYKHVKPTPWLAQYWR